MTNKKTRRSAVAYPDCFICRKHAGKEAPPPAGYIHEGRYFLLCHAPLNMGPSGTLIVESKRHFLDYSEMSKAEGVELFSLLRKLFPLMKKEANAERIYSVAMMDGAPHFHLWLVPRMKNARLRGVGYLAKDQVASERATKKIVLQIQRSL